MYAYISMNYGVLSFIIYFFLAKSLTETPIKIMAILKLELSLEKHKLNRYLTVYI